MPEREDRHPPRRAQRVVVLKTVNLPAAGPAQERDEWVAERGNRCRPGALHARKTRRRRHIPSYRGPPPPSGGTQSMIWYGSMMSHVLQWTQFEALICNCFPAEPSVASMIS